MSIRRRFGALGLGMGLGGGGVGASFNPADLNPVAWYDFSDASLLFTDAGVTPVSSDGDAIYQANDKSVSGFNLTQATLGSRPLYKTGIQNGLSVGRFDAVDDSLSVTFGVAISQPTTIFFVGKGGASDGVVDRFFMDSPDAAKRNALFRSTVGNISSFAGAVVSSTESYTGVKQPILLTFVFNGASSIMRRDGAQINTGNYGAQDFGGIILNTLTNGTNAWGIDSYEVVAINSAVSGDDLQNMETYLNNKWGIF